MPDNRDELDRLLDSVLATYADPGPDSGLASRILSRLAAEAGPAPRRRWLPWVIALPAAAVLLLFILLSGPETNHRAVAPKQARVSQQPPAAPQAANRPAPSAAPIRRAGTPLGKPRPRRAALAAHWAPLPKLDFFPTPQPLSPEEQALVEFAAHASKSDRESLLKAKEQADAPLRIAAIEIKPLEPPASGAN